MMRNEATQRQIDAANPRASTWLSANAGSGKTRVLTDRVARLLLDGTSPQNILCLTYTKAAASEMQNRLFRRLGAWAMAPEPELRENLAELGVEGRPDDAALSRARTLFARAVETPGGLKIQTIHSFCSALLRRFPLEAGVSPRFAEMDDRSAAQLMDEIVEEIADGPEAGALDALVRQVSDDSLTAITREIASNRDRFDPPLDEAGVRALFGLAEGETEETLLARTFLGREADLVAAMLPVLRAGGKSDATAAEKLAAEDFTRPNMAALLCLEGLLLTGAGAKEPFCAKIGKFPTKAARATLEPQMDALEDLMRRVEAAREPRLALAAARRSGALHRFAAAFLPRYAEAKLARGWLDFDDLILKARGLLTDPAVAAWILYRLDGGIDHILVDEAQDTSPAQWDVIELLAQEMAAGAGAHSEGERTIFVVGDKKQSIYSFQGADPDAFDRMRDHFAERLSTQSGLQSLELQHSFRSSEAVLSSVDRVFDGPLGEGLGRAVRHRAFHEALPGRVDLWPIAEKEPAPEDPEWFDPVDMVAPGDASVRLASEIAAEIRRLKAAGTTLPGPGGTRRPLTEGDILILVRGRGTLFEEIIRACKREGLAIAGADRLKLGAELAVRDLRALLAFLATPEDDLSLAAALRSPLFGWSEAELYDLAAGREGAFLWTSLRNAPAAPGSRIEATMEMLRDLREWVDFLRPYDLLERVLLRHGGRERLLARLGAEAEDGVDELLTQALAYERTDIPSLTGFLCWLDAEDVEVKRQAEGKGGKIRVMTVHGSKGLEAPVVILPDTMRRPEPPRAQIFARPDGTPLWRMPQEDCPAPLREARDLLVRKEDEERARLLYVAMTRAECWLIACGAGDPKRAEGTWHAAIAASLEGLGARALETPFGLGKRLEHGDWEAGALRLPPPPVEAVTTLPGWIDSPAAEPERPDEPLSPSDLGGAKALPGEGLDQPEALAHGSRLHRLLEHLPAHPPEAWEALAPLLIGEALDPAAALALLDEARGVLTAPDLAPLLTGALAEADLTAALPELGGRRILGTVDLLLVEADRVLAVDYKSNRVLPDGPEAVPEGILRQMGAYAAAMRQIWPGRRVETAILWTRGPRLMPLPADLTAAALARAGSP